MTVINTFRRTALLAVGPIRFDAPVPASIDPWATLLAAGAMGAVFLLRANIIVTLLGASAAGVVLHLFGLVG